MELRSELSSPELLRSGGLWVFRLLEFEILNNKEEVCQS